MKIKPGQVWYCHSDNSTVEVLECLENAQVALLLLDGGDYLKEHNLYSDPHSEWRPGFLFEQDERYVTLFHKLELFKTFKNLIEMSK